MTRCSGPGRAGYRAWHITLSICRGLDSESRPVGGSAVAAASGHRWAVTAQAAVVIGVVAGAAWAISAEWPAIHGGFGALRHARPAA